MRTTSLEPNGPKGGLPLAAAIVLLAQPGWSQEGTDVSFSVDFQGPSIGTFSTGGPQITAGDILIPAAGLGLGHPQQPLPPPAVLRSGGQLGLSNYSTCIGTPPPDFCPIEVDALSYGLDFRLPGTAGEPYRILFSVDEWVVGNGNPGGSGPSVTSEGGAVADACADVFTTRLDLGPGPVLPAPPRPNRAVIDGDGLRSAQPSGAVYPGVGLQEPTTLDQGVPDGGDNIDALDVGEIPDLTTAPIYFSLDADFLDPREGFNNTGAAKSQGFEGADVLVSTGSAGISLYASAQALGLDLFGAGTDDLDALILAENGTAGYQRSQTLYDWEDPNAPSDMLLFSVRRGSAIIGQIDSLQDRPIEEGDLLVPPLDPASNPNPGILIAAEAMGLSTQRSGGNNSDDMSAGDSRGLTPFLDCNNNGIPDWRDIASGYDTDDNMNGIPDRCERPCDADPSASCQTSCGCQAGSPCGNPGGAAGCANSTGVGALLWGTGSSSWGTDDFVLTTTNMPANKFCVLLRSRSLKSPKFGGDGLRCVGGLFQRYDLLVGDASGSLTAGPGLVGKTLTNLNPWDDINVGETWHYQVWYRDEPGSSPCGGRSNLSKAWTLTFTL